MHSGSDIMHMPRCSACGQVGAGWAQQRAWQCRRMCMCCAAAMHHMTGCSPAVLLWCTMVAQVELGFLPCPWLPLEH